MKIAMLKTAVAGLAAASISLFALADEVKSAPTKETAAAAKASKSKVGKALDGKLIKLNKGKVEDLASLGDPKTYVFYHSASW